MFLFIYSTNSKYCRGRDKELLPPPKVSNLPVNKASPTPKMTLLVWNARGLCSTERQTELKRICNERCIEILDALETKTKVDQFNDARERMGEGWKIMRNGDSESRDSIWLGWNPDKWNGTILDTHNQYIHARLHNTGCYVFDLTVVYGENTAVKRRELWNGINSLRQTSHARDWLLIGDFNEIRHPDERDGHGNFDRAGAGEFEAAIAGFSELEAIGGSYNWSNGVGPQHTRSRLDRALGNSDWVTRWPQVRPKLVMGTSSDHAGQHLQLTRLEKGSTPFKFFNSWLRYESFNSVFQTAWKTPVNGSPLYRL